MSGYVPNNRNDRPAPTPEPYNGDFHRQAPRPLEGGSTQTASCLVGLRFVWDNGECLGANLPYSLSPASGNALRGSLDTRGSLIQTIPSGEYEAQLLADADVDTDISSARAELQTVLDEILAAERAEAARLQAIQDQRSAFSNYVHRQLAVGKGFFLGAWGLLKTAKEFSDLVNSPPSPMPCAAPGRHAPVKAKPGWPPTTASSAPSNIANWSRHWASTRAASPANNWPKPTNWPASSTKTRPARPCSAVSPSTTQRRRTSRRSPSSAAAHCSKSYWQPY